MGEAGFLEERRIRPGSAAVVVLLHGTAITALLMAKGYVPPPRIFEPTVVTPIEIEPPPPPVPLPPTPQPVEQNTHLTTVPIPRPVPSPFPVPPAPPSPPPDLGALSSDRDVSGVPQTPPTPTPAPPPAPPVRIEPRMLSGDLQPPYPASEQRLEHEGSVVIRVRVGVDGRVIATEKVRATSDAFYEATARHARARWRFRPATVDGRPVEGSKVLTVTFRLAEA